MKFFHISYLLFFLFISCGEPLFNLSTGKHFHKKNIENPYFSNVNLDYVYKAKIDVFNNSFGGLFIVKKIKHNHHRVVFTTEFGAKLFDFEFVNDDFKVNFIQNKLNKKVLLSVLRKDFKLLITQVVSSQQSYLLPEYEVFLSKALKNHNYYYYTRKNAFLSKISSGNKRREKVVISFTNVSKQLARNIRIKHNNFKLNIELSFLH